MKTIGIVLAAGKSTRFGQSDKLLAPLNGAPLCTYAATAMRNCDVDDQIVCISNPAVGLEFSEFEVLRCLGNQSKSLRCGIERAIQMGAKRVLLTLADMPNITTGVLNELLARPETISACYSDRNRPTVPAAFSHVHFADLLNIDGDQGAKGILNAADEIGKVVISTAMALDIDTAEDLVRLQQQ